MILRLEQQQVAVRAPSNHRLLANGRVTAPTSGPQVSSAAATGLSPTISDDREQRPPEAEVVDRKKSVIGRTTRQRSARERTPTDDVTNDVSTTSLPRHDSSASIKVCYVCVCVCACYTSIQHIRTAAVHTTQSTRRMCIELL